MKKWKNRLYDLLRRMSLRGRITIFLLLCLLVFNSLLFQTSKLISQNITRNYVHDFTNLMQTSMEPNIVLMIDEINMMSLRLMTNEKIYSLMGNENIGKDEKNTEFKRILNGLLTHKDVVGDIIFISHYNEVYRYVPDTAMIPEPDKVFVEKVRNNSTPVWGSVIKDKNNNGYIMLGRKYYNFYTGQDIGHLIIFIRETAIQGIYNEAITGWGYSFIATEDNYIISHPDKKKVGSLIYDSSVFSTDKDDDYKVTSLDNQAVILTIHKFNKRLENIGVKWKIISVISSKELFAVNDKISKFILIFQISVSLVAIILSFKISSKVTAPISKLKEKIYSFNGTNTEQLLSKRTGDEIWELEKGYNAMIVRINELIHNNNIEKEKQREMELVALQAQINPHFVYNTLDAIGWIAKLKQQSDIEKLVMALAKFFRISLHKGDKFITVSEEIELIRSFVTIEQMRTPNKFEVEYDVDEDIFECKMLKIILQPIVENAIKHGIGRKRGKGTIKVRGFRSEDNLVFEVIDDGIGIDLDAVGLEKSKVHPLNSGYGVKNVNERIVLEYGKDYGLTFESKVGEGTKVTVMFKIRI